MTKKISELDPVLTLDSPALVPVVVGAETLALDMNAIPGQADQYTKVQPSTDNPVHDSVADGATIEHTMTIEDGHVYRITYLVTIIVGGISVLNADYYVTVSGALPLTIIQEKYIGPDGVDTQALFTVSASTDQLTLSVENNFGGSIIIRIAPSLIDEDLAWALT